MMEEVQCNQPARWLVHHPGDQGHIRDSMLFFYSWQIRHLATVSARWPLPWENPGCWAHAQPASLPPRPLGPQAHRASSEVAGQIQSVPFRPPNYWQSPLQQVPLLYIQIRHKYLHSLRPFREIHPYSILLSHTSSSPIFQSHSI